MSGRPVSTGSVVSPEGTVRAYLHIQRLEKIAAKVGGKDAQLLLAAAKALAVMSEKNRAMGRKIGNACRKRSEESKGASFTFKDAAEGICDLAADGPVVAYIGRSKSRVRVTRADTLPPGSRRIGRFDEGSDFRDVRRRVMGARA